MATEVLQNFPARWVIWNMFLRSARLGLGGGAVFGAGYGFLAVWFAFVGDLIGWAMGQRGSIINILAPLPEYLGFSLLGLAGGGLAGAIVGLIAGLINGILVGCVTSMWFTPLTKQHVYRRVIISISVGLTIFVATLYVFNAYPVSIPHPVGLFYVYKEDAAQFLRIVGLLLQGFVLFMHVRGAPILIAIGWSYFASRRLAAWYVDVATSNTAENDI